ncbi:hypothetical protein JRQ81_019398 [Phrynocephalus forsythii]|uniref:Uncharacterized protein n=1 Tax=Phrynocephalus forsythii TaxID=171643 RepID=A0A9Q0XMW6_9SAUR|nr:hypothetical protein JRQ81_019398 [Phrynocephalus forsythii]
MPIEELLMSEVLETYTTDDEIFKAIDKCVQKNDLEWSKCVDICSNGVAAKVGKVKGAMASKWQKMPPAAIVLAFSGN